MGIDFLSNEGKIELNQKYLETYREGLEKAASRISLISVLYSILSIYLIQLIQFSIVHNFRNLFFLISISLLIFCLSVSIVWTIRFLLPTKIAHVHAPIHFYDNIKKQYEAKGTKPEDMQQKIQATFLNELEKAVHNNYAAYKAKRKNFYYAFNFALIALIPYLVCASIMLGARKEEKAQKVEITNAAVIVHQLDSLLSKDK
jgi:cytochrome bd-type quinol oxidase subunit 2